MFLSSFSFLIVTSPLFRYILKLFIGVHWCLSSCSYSLLSSALAPFQFSPHLFHPQSLSGTLYPTKQRNESFITLSKSLLKQTSNNAASNLGRDKQLSAITSLNLCAKATLISLIMNNGGGDREACLCKFPHTVISFMLNSQHSGGA